MIYLSVVLFMFILLVMKYTYVTFLATTFLNFYFDLSNILSQILCNKFLRGI